MSGTTSAQSQSLGVLAVNWGGTRIDVDAKASSFSLGGTVSTPVVAGNKIYQSLSTVPPMVDLKFPLVKGQSITALRALNGTEMQIECDSGQTYILPSATIQGDLKVTGGAGSNVAGKWSGSPASEVIS